MSEDPNDGREPKANWAFYTRAKLRHRVDRPEHAYVELCYPRPGGPTHRLPLLTISLDGVSFLAPPELLGVSPGTRIEELALYVGLIQVTGELSLCHVTREPDGQTVCGGRFQPASDADRRKLDELIAALGDPRKR